MFKKILNIGIASVLLLTGCSSKVSASPASVAERAKTEVKSTEEKAEKKTDTVEKKEQSSGTVTKEKKTVKKAEAKSKASEKTNTKKDFSQSQKSAGTASAQTSKSNKQKKIKNSTAASSKEQSASSQHVHNWEYVKPTSHSETRTVVDKEAWDETVTDQAEWVESTEWIVCNGCGRQFRNPAKFSAHYDPDVDVTCGSYHIDTVDTVHPAVTHTVHHDAVTHEITVDVADGFGYYKCSCGATKEGW